LRCPRKWGFFSAFVVCVLGSKFENKSAMQYLWPIKNYSSIVF
jgi:hypothetical protein